MNKTNITAMCTFPYVSRKHLCKPVMSFRLISVSSLTSMCDYPQVRSDNLHVNTMLLLSDDHCSPQTAAVGVPIFICLA